MDAEGRENRQDEGIIEDRGYKLWQKEPCTEQ